MLSLRLKATFFISGILSLIAFGCLLFSSTSSFILSGKVSGGSYLGIGPFVAGSSTSVREVVYWSELNSNNACNQESELFKTWSHPNQLCLNGKFQYPPELLPLQIFTLLSTAFSALSCTISFSRISRRAIFVTITLTVCSMLTTIVTFSLWTTYSLAVKVQTGDIIPLWSSSGKLLPSQKVIMGFGFPYVMICFAFVFSFFSLLCSCSIVYKPLQRFCEGEEDEGSYGIRLDKYVTNAKVSDI